MTPLQLASVTCCGLILLSSHVTASACLHKMSRLKLACISCRSFSLIALHVTASTCSHQMAQLQLACIPCRNRPCMQMQKVLAIVRLTAGKTNSKYAWNGRELLEIPLGSCTFNQERACIAMGGAVQHGRVVWEAIWLRGRHHYMSAGSSSTQRGL